MDNPIIRSGLFGTPESYEALDHYIRCLDPEDRALAYTISVMTMNLCYKLVEAEKAKENA